MEICVHRSPLITCALRCIHGSMGHAEQKPDKKMRSRTVSAGIILQSSQKPCMATYARESLIDSLLVLVHAPINQFDRVWWIWTSRGWKKGSYQRELIKPWFNNQAIFRLDDASIDRFGNRGQGRTCVTCLQFDLSGTLSKYVRVCDLIVVIHHGTYVRPGAV